MQSDISTTNLPHAAGAIGKESAWRLTPWDLISGAALIIGVFLRWVAMTHQSFWFDEGLTAWLIGLPPAETVRMVSADVAAPLHFILLRYWSLCFGTSEMALRGMSALFATLSLILFYLLARRVLVKPLAVAVATWLFALCSWQIEYAKEARFYGMLGCLLLLSLYCAQVFLTNRSRLAFAGVVLASAAGLYTHNIALFYFVALNAFWLLYPSPTPLRRRMLDLLAADVVVGLLYLPWIPVLLQQTAWAAQNFWAIKPTGWDFFLTYSVVTGGRPYALATMCAQIRLGQFWTAEHVALTVVLIGAAPILVGLTMPAQRRKVLALAAWGLLPVVAAFIRSRLDTPIFVERIFIASSILVPLLAAVPLTTTLRMPVRLTMKLAVAVLMFISVMSVYAYFTKETSENWRAAYRYIAGLEREGTLLVFVANEGQLPFDYYESQDAQAVARDARGERFARTGCPQGFFDLDPPQTVRRVLSEDDLKPLQEAVTSGHWREIVLIWAHEWFSDPQKLAPAYLKRTCRLIEDKSFERVAVMRFAPPGKDGR